MNLFFNCLFPVLSSFRGKGARGAKMLMIMKLTAILLLSASLTVSAAGLGQRISLSVKNASLPEVFKKIEKQTDYTFAYLGSQLSQAKRVTLEISGGTLEQVLNLCFKDQPFTYEIIEKTIVVRPRESAGFQPGDNSVPLPPIDVKGRILNEKGEPVVASVLVKGTNKGVTTNDNGEFELKGVEKNATLVISGVSIETFEVKVNGRSELALNARIKIAVGEEVIINKGYYSTTQKLNTGAVTRISGADIQKQPVTDPLLALQGRVPGLYISQQSGVPGATYNGITLRGLNSISNGTDPLFIIDGVPFSSNSLTNISSGGATFLSPFNTINPSDIESIDILKDADATAIYGSRGANGVILISTKKGKSGKTRFNANVFSGQGKVASKIKLLNTQQYLAMRHEAFINDGATPGPNDYDINGEWDTTRYTDWQKVFIGGTSHETKAEMSISGGSANTNFLLGSSYAKQTTVFPGDFSDQIASFHVNLSNTSPNNKFHSNFSAIYSNDNSNLPFDLTNSITLAPDAPTLYDNSGNLNWQNNTWNNPMAILKRSSKSITENLISNLSLDYVILPGLQIKSSFGYSKIEMKQNILSPLSSYPPSFSTIARLRRHTLANNYIKNWIIEPQISYKLTSKVGTLDVLLGSTFQSNVQESIGQIAFNFSSDELINNIAAAGNIVTLNSNSIDYRYNAFFGRLSYNLQDKYIVNFTARRDGSSRFGPGYQFGNFGAIGIGWKFSKEKFFERLSSSIFSFGKLRASYGTTGNDQISDYQYLSTYSSYYYPYQDISGLYPTSLANPNYRWELVKKWDAALELGLFKDRINLSTDYYLNRTGNQLVGNSLPTITGFSSIIANLPAIIQNNGWEFQLSSSNIKKKDFSWYTTANLSIPKNKLVSYPNLAGSGYANRYTVGYSLFSKRAYHVHGVDPNTGVYSFDTKNTGGIPTYPDDLTATKPITQSFYGGIQNSFNYKGFEIDLFFQFVKQYAYNYMSYFPLPGIINYNQPIGVLDRWRTAGDVASIEQFSQDYSSLAGQAYGNAAVYGDRSIEDASFIRLKNVMLSYQLPQSMCKKVLLNTCKFYLQAQNLFTITNYKGLDPETSNALVLPPLRTIVGGIQFGF